MNYIALAVWTKPDMTIAESIGVALVGICVVLLELALLALFIKLLSKIISVFGKRKKADEPAPAETAPAPEAMPASAPVNGPVLKDVDDPTAAVIMAIVSNKSGIPLERLSFKSIKLLEDK